MTSKLLRCLLLLVLAGVAATTVRGQENLASQTFKQRLRGQYLHNDTAQAIISLYATRQAGGATWITSALLASLRIATTAPNNGGAAFLVSSPIIAYGVAKIAHYGNRRLEGVLTSYAQGQPLPRSLRRKLKPRFFGPIIQYKAVPVRAVPVAPAR